MDSLEKILSKCKYIPLFFGILSTICIVIAILSVTLFDVGWNIFILLVVTAEISSMIGIIAFLIFFIIAKLIKFSRDKKHRIFGFIFNLPVVIFNFVIIVIIILDIVKIPINDPSIRITEGFEGVIEMEVTDKDIDKKVSKKIKRIASSYDAYVVSLEKCTIKSDADLSNLGFERLGLSDCVFEDGFDYEKITQQDELYHLYIGWTNISDYSFLGEMNTVSTLYLYNCSIDSNATIILPPDLENLTVNECNISDGSFFTNSNFERLYYVDLSNNKLEDVSFLDSPNSQTIYELELNDNMLEDISFFNSQYTQNIYELNLSNNPIKDVSPIVNLKKVVELDLRGTSLQSDCVEHISKLTGMKRLWMSNIPMTDLRVIKEMENLEEAYFDGCGISSWDNADFSNKHKIEYLDLSNNKLSSTDGISELLTYSETSLELILKNNELTFDKKVEYDAEEFRGLYLDLSNNKITSLENFPDAKEGHYWKLKLYGNKIDFSDEKTQNWLYNNEIDHLEIDYSDSIKDLKIDDHFHLIWIKDNPDSDEEEKLEAEYNKWIAIDHNPDY